MDLSNYRIKKGMRKAPGSVPEDDCAFQLEDDFFVIHEIKGGRVEYELSLKLPEGLISGMSLKTWIVPRNLPTEKEIKHLAIRGIDASLNWAKFEGVVPEGSPRAGQVRIWDCGRFGMLRGGLAEKRISLNLFGKIINGRYVLQKFDTKNQKDSWLIWKKGNQLGF